MRFRHALPSLLLLLVGACSSSDKVAGPAAGSNPAVHGSLSAKINGTSWVATGSASAVNHNGIVAIAGTDLQQTLGFAFAGTGPGTYTVGSLSPVNAVLTTASGQGWSAAVTIGSGSVTVTSLTANSVAGTFSFTMQPTGSAGAGAPRTVTEGKFDLKF